MNNKFTICCKYKEFTLTYYSDKLQDIFYVVDLVHCGNVKFFKDVSNVEYTLIRLIKQSVTIPFKNLNYDKCKKELGKLKDV